jgi:TonB family protein
MRIFLCLVMGTISVFGQDWTPKRIVAIADYVPIARTARISGDVQVKCFLDADGPVLRAEVLSGHPLLREQARKNALLWKFQRTGPKASNTVTLNYQYRLEGELQDQARMGAHTVFFVDLPNTIQIIAPVAWVNP